VKRATPRRWTPAVAAVALIACGGMTMTACGPAGTPAASTAATPATSPGDASAPRVEMPSGAVYRLELAKTPDEQAQGLMFRESLPARTGMLFLFPEGGVHKFWMKNTMIPLDMVWMDPAGRVLFVSAGTPPCKSDPCASYGPDGPASSVLEIAGGMALPEGIKVGSTLKLVDVR
jgi:uncharacterized protein